ncbi:MAG: serine hydrolase domain-containing protein [Candidatus Binatia bacterium]
MIWPQSFRRNLRTGISQIPLGVYLAQNLPARFIAPGRICSYANHGMALAGFLVESVSGLPFHEYVSQEILRPLGMSRSSFGMEPAVLESLAQGYVFSSGSYRYVPVDFRNEVPSGSLVATGTDMGRFLRAFLNGGELDGTRILGGAATSAMLTRQFSHHPAMRGVGLGFWEFGIDGRAYWGHDGDIVGWNARAILAPERGLGLFVAYTGTDTLKAFADRVTAAVFDGIYPGSSGDRLPRTASATSARMEGVYRWTRTVRDTPDRLFTPYWLVQYRVRVVASDVLELTNPVGLFPASRWEAVSGALFQEVGGKRLLAFREEDGRIRHLLLEGPVPMAFERLSRWESVSAQVGIALFFIAAFLVIGVLASTGLPRSRARRLGLSRLMAVASAANVLFLVALPPVMGLNMFFSNLLPLPELLVPPGNPTFFYGMPVAAVVLLGLPLCALVVTAVLAVQTISACRHRTCSPVLGCAVAAFVALQCAFASFLHYWNLLGYTS